MEWHCPQCGLTARTRPVPNRWHPCPRLKGVSVQLLRKGVPGSIRLIEREDYVGNDKVQLLGEDGRPVMAAITTRDNGQDVVVYAPTATGSARAS